MEKPQRWFNSSNGIKVQRTVLDIKVESINVAMNRGKIQANSRALLEEGPREHRLQSQTHG